jgi:uroporphyrinogen decarboxylase
MFDGEQGVRSAAGGISYFGGMNEAVITQASVANEYLAATEFDAMTGRERFLRATRCEVVDYAPIWMMRQAGRALPEYRKLKENFTFLEMVRTPELAATVTLQPIKRFGFDAAIIFSDILVIPEAMGMGYRFRESGGVEMDFTIRSAAEIEKLSVEGVVERLQYMLRAIQITKEELNGDTALIGFAGSPWTLANFMLDGGSAKEHGGGLKLFREDRSAFEQLCGKLTVAVTELLRAQIRAGVDAIQIFDSLGGILPQEDFQAASGVWIQKIIAGLGGAVPTILFSKGTRDWLSIIKTGADVVGIDHGISLSEARRKLPPGIGIQGNLNPEALVVDSAEHIARRAARLVDEMRGRDGYIFNLGHGLLPSTRLENVQAIIDTVRGAA